MTKQNLTAEMRENAIKRYVRALHNNDLDSIAQILELALYDTELDRVIVEINQEYEKQNIGTFTQDIAFVHTLLEKHFPANFVPLSSPITLGHVAAALQKKQMISANDQTAHQILITNQTPLPKGLSLQDVMKLAVELKVSASDGYWRAFRNLAITMKMGQESANEAHLAAARESKKRKSHD